MDHQRLLDVARSALLPYGLGGREADLCVIARRPDEATLRVSRPEAQYSLRLRFAGARGRAVSALRVESELRWLDSLVRETRLAVPRPFRTQDGAWVAVLAPDDEGGIVASVVSWVDGTPLAAGSPDGCRHPGVLGAVVAALHDHAERWIPPAVFDRPTHDEARTRWVDGMMRAAAARGRVEAGHAAVIDRVLARIALLKAALPREPRHWGMLHGDLYPANIVVKGPAIGLIDFSLCGYGYYVQDLASCAIAFEPPVIRAFLESYSGTRPLSPASLAALEACALETRLARYGVAFGHPDCPPQATRTFPDWVETACRRFLEAR